MKKEYGNIFFLSSYYVRVALAEKFLFPLDLHR